MIKRAEMKTLISNPRVAWVARTSNAITVKQPTSGRMLAVVGGRDCAGRRIQSLKSMPFFYA